MLKSLLFLLLFIFNGFVILAQQGKVSGYIRDPDGRGIHLATVIVQEENRGTSSDRSGYFSLTLPAEKEVIVNINHINYLPDTLSVTVREDQVKSLNIVLIPLTQVLDSVEIASYRSQELRRKVSTMTLEPRDIQMIPAPFKEIGSLLATLPGVISNNELSSAYSVRGGNFEENLIYVNDIPVYRPFLIRAGAQEGLGFVNPDMTENIEFSTGGWEPKYGDKLSSSLNVKYKEPEKWGGSLTAGLLGGSFNLEGASKNGRFTFVSGIRHKRTEYLLNTFETQGEYLPQFTDFQAYGSVKLGKPGASGQYRTDLGLLIGYGNNQYKVIPESRETSFGTFSIPLNLYVGFIGQEVLNYNTFQTGLKLTHHFSDRFSTRMILSNYRTRERENFEVEAGYRICEVDKRPGSETFNRCISVRGIGTDYNYGRNRLDGNVLNFETRNDWVINQNNTIEFGIGYSRQNFDDVLHEYSFVDSADFVTITELITAENNTLNNQLTFYAQHDVELREKHFITYGIRMNYSDINDQLLFSPRIQYGLKPEWSRDFFFRAAVGLYSQPPFYREFRRFDGSLNKQVKAQSSLHLIGGIDYRFLFWGRPFTFMAEIYYKYLYDVNPYDVENIRIRYYAENIAIAYAAGIDLRISGEFIPGDQSWFSLGLLSTREDPENDNRGFMPRPTDQLVNFNIFFQDHIPQYPSYRVYLNLNLASGLPFGPPRNPDNRNNFRGDSYQRVDLGFSKVFTFAREKKLRSLHVTLEVLNLTGRANNITYYWVKDFNNIYYGVPNALTTRFFNLKFFAKF